MSDLLEIPGRDLRPRDLPLLLVGIDHHTAGLELRERVAYGREEIEDLLLRLLAGTDIAEACVLSTCNRTEVYLIAREPEAAYRTVMDLAFGRRAPEIEREGRFYVHRGEQAARHLLAVACGIESMVVGEPEILGQVREAGALGEGMRASGTVLRRLVRSAVATGARARAETGIGEGAVSLGYGVVELARQIFQSLEETTVLLIGAGEVAHATARSLVEKGVRRLRVANRSAGPARAFADRFPGTEILPLEGRFEALAEVNVVIATTSAPAPLLTGPEVAGATRRRPPSPLLVVDLGVPRNVADEVGRLGNVFLYRLDALEQLIQRNLRQRRAEVPRVESIIDEELTRFLGWLKGLEAEPLVQRLHKRGEEIRRREVEGSLQRFPPATHEDLERLTRALVRKILHHPTTHLRSGGADELSRLDLVRELFDLDGGEEEEDGGDRGDR